MGTKANDSPACADAAGASALLKASPLPGSSPQQLQLGNLPLQPSPQQPLPLAVAQAF